MASACVAASSNPSFAHRRGQDAIVPFPTMERRAAEQRNALQSGLPSIAPPAGGVMSADHQARAMSGYAVA